MTSEREKAQELHRLALKIALQIAHFVDEDRDHPVMLNYGDAVQASAAVTMIAGLIEGKAPCEIQASADALAERATDGGRLQ